MTPDIARHKLITCVNIPLIRAQCDLPVFVETGIFRGDGVAVARHLGFQAIHSCDIDEKAVAAARKRFPEASVQLVQQDSRTFIKDVINRLSQPTLFWLDAHFADEPTAGEAGEADYPLLAELRLLHEKKDVARDAILCDDTRIIADPANPSFAGEKHPDFAPNPKRFVQYGLKLRDLWGPFSQTHDVYLINFMTGILMMLPRGTPYVSPRRGLLVFLRVPLIRLN